MDRDMKRHDSFVDDDVFEIKSQDYYVFELKSQVSFVDDFGVEVYRCRYDTGWVWADNCVVVGSTIPGLKVAYVMAPTVEAIRRHKQQGIWFHENEANCNTCAHLRRMKHDKSPQGFVHAGCDNPEGRVELRQFEDKTMIHPDDPMHMPCYVSRWAPVDEAECAA